MSYPSACITNRRIPTVNCCIHLVVPNHTWKIKVFLRPLFTLRFFHLSSFLDKLYVMSSNEALAHFMRNPRLYLAPHLPRPPCKLCVLGPPHSGKTTVSQLVAQRYNAKVILPPSLSLVWSANFIGQKNLFPIALIDLLSMLSLIGQKSCPIKKRKCSCIHVFSRAWRQLRIVAWLSDWLTVLCSDWQLYLYFVTIPVECRKKLLSWSRSFNKWLANLALPNEN